MEIYEIRIKVYTLRDIYLNSLRDKLQKFMDKSLAASRETLVYHNAVEYKEYSFGSLTPIEKAGVYKEGNIYNFTVRTSNPDLADYFIDSLPNNYTNELRGLKAEGKIIENLVIKSIYSLTPVIIKNDGGYWQNNMSVYSYISRIENNLFKKYKTFISGELIEDFRPFADFQFVNRMPIACRFKTTKLLGDKVQIDINGDYRSQEIAYLAISDGIGEMNSRGFGFVGFKY